VISLINKIKYHAYAQLFKVLSSSGSSRKAYRLLAKRFGQKKHSLLCPSDVRQGELIRQIIRNRGYHQPDPVVFFELGTGWTHSYAVYLSLFYPGRFILYDIQDNRQFKAFKERTTKLIEGVLVDLDTGEEGARERIQSIDRVLKETSSFEEIYPYLSMEYLIDADGSLDKIPTASIDILFSVDVLEHIPKIFIQYNAKTFYRILKPGGLMIHFIGLDDHLMHYISTEISKRYLRYSDFSWKAFINSKLQYINRLQSGDYLRLFASANFKQVFFSSEQLNEPPAGSWINKEFVGYDRRQLLETRLFMAWVKE